MADDEVAAVELRKQVRKLQELFKGRFSEEESVELLRTHGSLAEAADFVLNGDPAEVRRMINDRNEALVDTLRRDSEYVNEVLQEGLQNTSRLFGCEPCDRYWWRKVPARKEVSRCKVCEVKYDPVPRHQEWGLGEFVCDCGNTFWGKAWMSHTESPCYSCRYRRVSPRRIVPPSRQHRPRNARSPHSCNAPNCYNRAEEDPRDLPGDLQGPRYEDWSFNSARAGRARRNSAEEEPQRGAAFRRQWEDPPVCPHEQSPQRRRVLYPSMPHVSTGSTVNTFMTQGSLLEDYEDLVPMPGVPEEDED